MPENFTRPYLCIEANAKGQSPTPWPTPFFSGGESGQRFSGSTGDAFRRVAELLKAAAVALLASYR
jgi:hypothetical protein